MDSTLIVFYSHTGVSRRVARLLADQQGWPVGEVHEKFALAGRGPLRCVLESVLRLHPRINYNGPNPADFRTVVLVSPVWAFSLSGPMRSFVHGHRDTLQHVAVLMTMGGAGASLAAREVAHILGRQPVLTAGITQKEVEDGAATQRVQEFADALRPGGNRRQPADTAWSPLAG
ncbi:flavodoxin [Ramlibacter sp. GTP1]|uniref:Flavodoxin n=2 Tax=Ramlibacter albus TaxID=2079448 RepID=A0A923M4R7_9BURK|nr:flavodoxin [Ramlibacter albus]